MNSESSDRAENAVLGGLLRWNNAIADVAAILRPRDFRQAIQQDAYAAMLDLWECGKPIDLVSLAEALQAAGKIYDGVYATIGQWWEGSPTGAHALYDARIVKNASINRRLAEAAAIILQRAEGNPAQPAESLLEEAEKEIFAIADMGCAGEMHELASVVNEASDRIDARSTGSGDLSGIPTGFEDLDAQTAGLQNSELIVLAARPSVGKTALGIQIAAHAAVDLGLPVLFVSLEQSRQELGERLLCSYGAVDNHRARRGMLDPVSRGRLVDARDKLRRAPLFIDDAAAQGMLRIAANARRLKLRKGVALVVLDYLQLVRPDEGRVPRQEQVASVSRRLKIMAREMAIPVLALAQLNRGVEDRAGQRPRLADLRESGAIEQDADVVLLLHRQDAQPGQSHAVDVIVAKQRNGPTGETTLRFDPQFTRFGSFYPASPV